VSIAKRYIGDGVYADFDGYHVVLTTERENGVHLIYLDPDVVRELARYVADVRLTLGQHEGAP
jgi:hypothetical protein